MDGQPAVLVAEKLTAVRRFGALLRRFTALNHLAQARQTGSYVSR